MRKKKPKKKESFNSAIKPFRQLSSEDRRVSMVFKRERAATIPLKNAALVELYTSEVSYKEMLTAFCNVH